MEKQTAQSYANHRRNDKVYLALGVMLLLAAILSVVGLAAHFSRANVGLTLLSVAAIGLLVNTRRYATTVQDRIIRLEMRLRLERLLPGDLQARIPDLALAQLIGLRFASDEEMPALVRKVLDERILKADDIKKRVKNWQADHLRV
jgi:hypothetical protein